MEAGFSPLGRDLGGGELDQRCFLRDDQREDYLANKSDIPIGRHWVTWQLRGQDLFTLHHRALSALMVQLERSKEPQPSDMFRQWCQEFNAYQALNKEGGTDDPVSTSIVESLKDLGTSIYTQIAMSCQEDITVLAQRPASALVMGHICAPSFWDPEHMKNASFWSIHKPVPGFPRDERVADRLAEHIAQRGPLVRFVWTLTSNDRLDQHPSHHRRPWSEADQIWYRVERQLTIPLSGMGSVFLIRTYVHPLESLCHERRQVLREAIEQMSDEIADYKGLRQLKESARLLDLISAY